MFIFYFLEKLSHMYLLRSTLSAKCSASSVMLSSRASIFDAIILQGRGVALVSALVLVHLNEM